MHLLHDHLKKLSPKVIGKGILTLLLAILISACYPGMTSTSPATSQPEFTIPPPATSSLKPSSTLSPIHLSTATFSAGVTRLRDLDDMLTIYISAGPFEMGRMEGDSKFETLAHSVTLDAFWIDIFEITIEQYAKCVSNGACQPPADFSSNWITNYYGNPIYRNYPVVWVS